MIIAAVSQGCSEDAWYLGARTCCINTVHHVISSIWWGQVLRPTQLWGPVWIPTPVSVVFGRQSVLSQCWMREGPEDSCGLHAAVLGRVPPSRMHDWRLLSVEGNGPREAVGAGPLGTVVSFWYFFCWPFLPTVLGLTGFLVLSYLACPSCQPVPCQIWRFCPVNYYISSCDLLDLYCICCNFSEDVSKIINFMYIIFSFF